MLVQSATLAVQALLYKTTNAKKVARLEADNRVLLNLVSDSIRQNAFVTAAVAIQPTAQG
jgi:hypothetical protein